MRQSPKACYGVLDHVFPMGGNGLREVSAECFRCPDGPRCLRAALSTKEGLELRAALLERRGGGGLVGRLRMWSARKELNRLGGNKAKGERERWR